MRYALLLLLCGCGGASHAYMDGAPLAPPEPRTIYTPVGAGLPEYWGSPEVPKVERSPHTRELPPTREPGIWAGDAPPSKRVVTLPHVYGVELPIPDSSSESRDVSHLKMCANMLPPTMKRSGVGDPGWLTASEARCVVAGYLWQCMEFMKDTYLRDWMRPADHKALAAEIQAAREFFKRSCAGDGDTERARGLYLMRPKWDVREANP